MKPTEQMKPTAPQTQRKDNNRRILNLSTFSAFSVTQVKLPKTFAQSQELLSVSP